MSVGALLEPADLERWRTALLAAGYTVDGLTDALGPAGEDELARGDLAGVRRRMRGDDPLAVLSRLFLLGLDVPEPAVARAFAPLPVEAAVAAGVLVRAGAHLRAGVEIRPHGSDLVDQPWWIVSDLGADLRPGPLDRDHVLGAGLAAVSLAGVAVRAPVARALDLGTGSGIQALHLGGHADTLVATDVSARALRFAATGWGLSWPGRPLDLREGSWTDPVAGEVFDQIVTNPPFVVSPAGTGDYTYRDGGEGGDAVSRRLVAALPGHLAPGGTAQLLANWIVPDDGDWAGRVTGWVPAGVDAWIWQREVADLGTYAALWLRDAGDGPHLPGYADRYDAWVDGLRALGAVAVGLGSIHLHRPRSDGDPVTVVAEDLVQPLDPPLGEAVAGWFDRARWLATRDDRALLAAPLRPAPDLLLETAATPGPAGWRTGDHALRLAGGLGWRVVADALTADVVGALDGERPVGLVLELAALTHDDTGGADALAARAVPVLRDLIGRGLLLPPASDAS